MSAAAAPCAWEGGGTGPSGSKREGSRRGRGDRGVCVCVLRFFLFFCARPRSVLECCDEEVEEGSPRRRGSVWGK